MPRRHASGAVPPLPHSHARRSLPVTRVLLAVTLCSDPARAGTDARAVTHRPRGLHTGFTGPAPNRLMVAASQYARSRPPPPAVHGRPPPLPPPPPQQRQVPPRPFPQAPCALGASSAGGGGGRRGTSPGLHHHRRRQGCQRRRQQVRHWAARCVNVQHGSRGPALSCAPAGIHHYFPCHRLLPRSYSARTVDFKFSNFTSVLRYQPARTEPLRWTANLNSFAVDLPAPGMWCAAAAPGGSAACRLSAAAKQDGRDVFAAAAPRTHHATTAPPAGTSPPPTLTRRAAPTACLGLRRWA